MKKPDIIIRRNATGKGKLGSIAEVNEKYDKELLAINY